MSATTKVSRRAVAALFLQRQQLDRPRTRRLSAASLESFVGDVCGLQIDSVNVIDRAHHLTLWSRFGPYDRAALERLIYKRRVLFEYLSHVACFVATRDLPLWRSYMLGTPERWSRVYPGQVARMPVEEVARAIAERGPLGNADFERSGGGKAGGWWSWKPATHALDYLWKCGRIGVHSRQHFQKRYAPLEQLLPQLADTAPLSAADTARERLLRSLAAMGAATRDDLKHYWTWPGMRGTELKDALDSLLEDGRVRELRVEHSDRPWFVRTADMDALESAARARRPSRGTTLLCPFDSFLWYRERTLRLFGYFYRIEIYVPAHKRTHGYYTLPVLHEGHLVGRVDLKTHRAAGTLEARHVHLEPWFAAGEPAPAAGWGRLDRDEAMAGIAASLRSLARFVDTPRVKLARVTPARLKPALVRALAAAEAAA